MYDLIIVGAGPAGIFTALELLRKSSTPHKILLVEKGKPVEKRHQGQNRRLRKLQADLCHHNRLFRCGCLL